MRVGADLAAPEHVHAPADHRRLGVVLGFGQPRHRPARRPARAGHRRVRGVGAVKTAEQHRLLRPERSGRAVLHGSGQA